MVNGEETIIVFNSVRLNAVLSPSSLADHYSLASQMLFSLTMGALRSSERQDFINLRFKNLPNTLRE